MTNREEQRDTLMIRLLVLTIVVSGLVGLLIGIAVTVNILR